MQIASFDLGAKNTDCYIEEINIEELQKLKPPAKCNRLYAGKKYFSKIDRGTQERTPTPEYQTFLNNVYLTGKMIWGKKVQLVPDEVKISPKGLIDKDNILDCTPMVELTKWLNKYKKHFDNCEKILIEKQRDVNHTCQRIEQHLISWFTITYNGEKIIILYPSTAKYRLGCPRYSELTQRQLKTLLTKKRRKNKNLPPGYELINKTKRKAWAVSIAKEIMELRKDKKGIKMTETAKADDFSDCVIQLQHYKCSLINGCA